MRKGLILFALLFSGTVISCNESVEICSPHCEDGYLVTCTEFDLVKTACPYGCKANTCVPAETAQCVYSCISEREQMYCEKDGTQGVRTCAFACVNGECTDK